MKQYLNIVGRAQNVSQRPFHPYTGQMVAPLSPLEQQSQAQIGSVAGMAQPYLQQAGQYAQQSAATISPQQWSADAIKQYENPFQSDVINATMAQMNEMNAQQQQQVMGNAISQGAWGGDRSAVAQAELARQQGLASGQTLSQLNAQNYAQAAQQFQQQQAVGMQAQEATAQNLANAASMYGNLGVASQQAGLQGLMAQAQLGGMGRAVQQAQDTAAYQQFLNKQAYPFQSTQFLSNIVEGIGGQAGGSTTYPSPSALSQIAGIGLGALGYGMGMMGASRGGGVNRASGGGVRKGYFDGGGIGLPYSTPALNPMDPNSPVWSMTAAPYSVPATRSAVVPAGQQAITGMGTPGIRPAGGIGAFNAGQLAATQGAGVSAPTAPTAPTAALGYSPQQAGAVGAGAMNALGIGPGAAGGGAGTPGGYGGPGYPQLTGRDKWLSLGALGASMAASTSPFPGVAIGQGLQAGIGEIQRQRENEFAAQKLWQEGQIQGVTYTPGPNGIIVTNKLTGEVKIIPYESLSGGGGGSAAPAAAPAPGPGAPGAVGGGGGAPPAAPISGNTPSPDFDATVGDPGGGDTGAGGGGGGAPAATPPGGISEDDPNYTKWDQPPNLGGATPPAGRPSAAATPAAHPARTGNVADDPSFAGNVNPGAADTEADRQEMFKENFYPTIRSKEIEAETLAKQEKAQEANDGAIQTSALLDEAERDMKALPTQGPLAPGKDADFKRDVVRTYNQFIRSFGGKPDDELTSQEAATEDLSKLTNRLGFALGRSSFGGSREALGTIEKTIAANPSLENSPAGFRLVLAGLRAQQDRAKDYYSGLKKWQAATRGNTSSYDDWFNRTNPMAKYETRAMLRAGDVPIKQADFQKFQAQLARAAPADRPRMIAAFDHAYGVKVGKDKTGDDIMAALPIYETWQQGQGGG